MRTAFHIRISLAAASLVLAAVHVAYAAPQSPLESALRAKLAPAAERASIPCAGELLLRPADVRAFYRLRGFRPYWQHEDQLHPDTDALLEILRSADREGLQPADYHVDALARVFAGRATLMDQNPAAATLLQADLELLLTDAILSYGDHVACGRIDAESIYEEWQNPERDFDPVLALTGVLTGGGSPPTALAALRPPHTEYALLLDTMAQYCAIRDAGGWPAIPAGETLRAGESDPRVPLLRERLRVTGDLPSGPLVYTVPIWQQYGVPLIPVPEEAARKDESAAAAELLYDAQLVGAIERFQARHGLDEDGIIGAQTLAALNVAVEDRIDLIALNLERMRWLPRDLGERYIRINIPELRLEVIEDRQTILSMRTIVGRADRPTPVFSSKLTYLEFNPYWTIPEKLTKEDLLPRIVNDPGYLVDRDIRVYSDWRGRTPEIDPYTIDWAQVDLEKLPYRLRQEPGPRNPLGRVKFMFPNPFEVYIHDTTSRWKFTRASRYYSSGCIRIEEPIALVDYLLGEREEWDTEGLQEILESRENKTVGLYKPIPVHLLYLSSWVSNGGLVNFRDDVYSYDALLQDALAVRSAALMSDRIASLASGEDMAVTDYAVVAQAEAALGNTEPGDEAVGALEEVAREAIAAESGPSLTNAMTNDAPTVNTVSASPHAGNVPDKE